MTPLDQLVNDIEEANMKHNSTLPDSGNPESKQSIKAYDKEWWFEFQAKQFQDIRDLTRKKNNDYTGGSMTDNPFANFDEAKDFGVDPLLGLSLRMGDKMQRLKSFCKEGLSFKANGDTVEDIFKDLIGYSVIALGIIERGKKTHKYTLERYVLDTDQKMD